MDTFILLSVLSWHLADCLIPSGTIVNVHSVTMPALFLPSSHQSAQDKIRNQNKAIFRCALKYLLLLLPIFIESNLLFAQTVETDSLLNLLQLDEVTVSARRKDLPIITVQKLEGARLEALSTQSVADAIRYFSGVQIKDYGGVGGLKTVDVRSMGSNHLGVFYDGIEIGNAQNGTVDLGKFSMDNIEQVALYNGQRSEIFQSAKDFGAAGTLYLRTRRPRFTADKPYNLQVSLKGGTFGLANPSVLYEQRLTDNLHLSANAEYTHAHGRYHFRYRKVMPSGTVAWDTTAVRQNGDVESWRAEAGLFGYFTDGKWHVKGYFYDSEKGIPGAIVNNVWKNSQRQWDRNAFVQGNFTKTIVNGYDMQVNAKYSNDHLRYLNPDTTLMYIDNSFTQQEVYVSMAHRLNIFGPLSAFGMNPSDLNWDVALSADYQYNFLEGNLANFVFPERHTVLAAAATQLYWKYLRAQASLLGTFIFDRLHHPTRLTPTASNQKPALTPAVFLSYQPYLPEEFFLRAFYKQVFRMPTFNDLYYTDIGNISLQPERATQYDIGAEYNKQMPQWAWQQISAKIDGYFNQIHDKIVAIPKGNGQYRWQMMNLGYVEILGCDVNLSTTLKLGKEVYLSLAAAYTYQRARDLSDPQEPLTYGGQIAYIPWHSGSATANLLWRGLSVNYAFIYVGERYHNSANIPANYEQPWYTHDLSISYELELAIKQTAESETSRKPRPRLHFALEVNNMFNQQYEIIRNYPMPGINGKGIVKIIL